MTKLTVLCSSCNTPLMMTAPEKLTWPITGNMFTNIHPHLYMRDMPLHLDYFCPVCEGYPFYADASSNGHRGVARYLNIQGPDGKPKRMSVEEIKGLPPVAAVERKTEPQPMPEPEYRKPGRKPGKKAGKPTKKVRKGTNKLKIVKPDPILDEIEAQVRKGGKDLPPNAPPTAEEIAELSRGRLMKEGKNADKSPPRPAYELGYREKGT